MVGVGEILAQTRRLLSVDPALVGAAILVLSGLGFVFDAGIVTDNSFNLLITGAALAFQFAVTQRLLRGIGYAMPEKPRGGAFVGLTIIAGLAILLGFVLLIVPGIVLLVRWSLSTPILIASEDSITDSLRRSWHHTAGHFWAILISLIVIYLPCFALGATGLVMAQGSPFVEVAAADPTGWTYAGVLIADLAFNIAIVGGWVATVAIFSLLQPSPAIAEVFE